MAKRLLGSGVDIGVNELEWAKLTISLEEAIQKWSDGMCEDYSVGWWYTTSIY